MIRMPRPNIDAATPTPAGIRTLLLAGPSVTLRVPAVAAGCALATRVFGLGMASLFGVTAATLILFGMMYAVGVWRYFSPPRQLPMFKPNR